MTDATATLDQFQKGLEAHFAALAEARAQRSADVFALEHDLAPEQLKVAFEALHTNLRLEQRLSPHWLLWVIYSAELGYDYDGREYWQSFEERTPLWAIRGDRQLIRRWYNKFQTTYRGIKPSGKWADWFSIIAWPITHSVLPKDLQIQLARSLYDQRYRLAALAVHSAGDIGQLMAQRTTDASSRFRIFLEQEVLVGRIVLALLQGAGTQAESDLLPSTLNRIVVDLEKTRNAREWLHDARRAVEKTRIQGAAAPGSHTGQKITGPTIEKDAPPSTRLSFSLRRTAPGTWAALAHIPNLGQVAALTPELRTYFKATRATVAGAQGWKPGGWLLFGSQQVVLKDWPAPGQPLIHFERPNSLAEHLLRTDLSMPERALHIFKVGRDGIAWEVTSRLVRPGSTYVLLYREQQEPSDSSLPKCQVNCTGVHGVELRVPSQVTPLFEAALRKLSLGLTKTVRIWPAALPARRWDGEGQAEWLAQEEVCVAIGLDHQVDGIVIELDDSQTVQVRSPSATKPILVGLGQLPPGIHGLKVTALRGFGSFASTIAEGRLSIHIRQPEPWLPGTTSHCGLAVTCDPTEPSLDDFWNGSVQLTALGPEGRNVTCALELLGGANEVLKGEPVGVLHLPVIGAAWERAYAQAVKSWQQKDPWSYLSASHGRLVIDGNELGRFTVPLARDVVPLRWISKTASQRTTIRLLDDTGADTPPVIGLYDFRRPATQQQQDAKQCLAGIVPSWPGGLYVATTALQSQGLVLSLPKVEGGLQGLSIQVDADALPEDRGSVLTLLEKAEMWADAKLSGPLALARRDHVLRAFFRQLFRTVCGRKWADSEDGFERSSGSPDFLRRLEEAIGKPIGFGISVSNARSTLCSLPAEQRTKTFAELAAAFGITKDDGLCETALRLSARPHRFRVWAGESAAARIRQLFDAAILVRAARLMSVVGANEDGSLLGPLGRGWEP